LLVVSNTHIVAKGNYAISSTQNVLLIYFRSVSGVNTINIKTPPLVRLYVSLFFVYCFMQHPRTPATSHHSQLHSRHSTPRKPFRRQPIQLTILCTTHQHNTNPRAQITTTQSGHRCASRSYHTRQLTTAHPHTNLGLQHTGFLLQKLQMEIRTSTYQRYTYIDRLNRCPH
jgi:hypothetical protein